MHSYVHGHNPTVGMSEHNVRSASPLNLCAHACRLAKENDILWTHGGRPDDVTCVLARISDKPPINLSSSDARTSVPGGAVGGLGGSPYGGPAILEQRLRALVPQDGAQVLCMQ